MRNGDTIVAISSATASPATPAARMIVRLAGPEAVKLVDAILLSLPLREGVGGGVLRVAETYDKQRTPHPNPLPQGEREQNAAHCRITIDGLTVAAWIYTFRAPHSYTGDDLIELHLPGNLLLARLAIDQFIAAGARLAEPGEFTARAFLSGRLDLAAAEGVAMAISATHQHELQAARQLMSGELAVRLRPHLDLLAGTLALLETGIDFSDQDVSFIDATEVAGRAARIHDDLARLLAESPQIERLTHRAVFVLMGLPNAGKSTLLNALSGIGRAVVSDIAGTTRDALSADVALRRGIVEVIDVAGLETPSDDLIARQMQLHAARAIEEADFAIHVIDATANSSAADLPRPADLIVLNKCDVAIREEASRGISISAQRGDGIASMREAMDALAFGADVAASRIALTSRHRAAIDLTMRHLAAVNDVADVPELAAFELRAALDSLGQVLGQVTPDDVLGRVFATFCIGK